MKNVSLASIFILVSFALQGQTSSAPESSYKLMQDIISLDTVVSEVKAKFLSLYVDKGKISKEDSIKFVNVIRNTELLLYKKQENVHAKELLENDLEKEDHITKYLSREVVESLIRKIPADRDHGQFYIPGGIKLTTLVDKRTVYHKFSVPFELSNPNYLVYHFRSGRGPTNMLMEFILFEDLGSSEYKIRKRFVLYQH